MGKKKIIPHFIPFSKMELKYILLPEVCTAKNTSQMLKRQFTKSTEHYIRQ